MKKIIVGTILLFWAVSIYAQDHIMTERGSGLNINIWYFDNQNMVENFINREGDNLNSRYTEVTGNERDRIINEVYRIMRGGGFTVVKGSTRSARYSVSISVITYNRVRYTLLEYNDWVLQESGCLVYK